MTEREFAQQFENYFSKKRDEMREKYNRVLPAGELIFNRFDKNTYLNGGEGSSIYDTSVIMGKVEIGNHVWIGPYTIIEAINAPVVIGNYVSINAGTMIYSHDSTKYYVSGGVDSFETGPVSIGDFTVIGTMCIVGKGIAIGEHCVVASNSYVNKDIPDNTIVAGNPARVIGSVVIDSDGSVEFVYE